MALIIGIFFLWFNYYIGKKADQAEQVGVDISVIIVRSAIIIFMVFDIFIN